MQIRRWAVAAVVGVVVGGTAVYLWHAQARPHVRPGTTVSLHDGQVNFRAPEGWRREACPSGSSGCVDFRPPGGAPGLHGDALTVIVSTPDPQAPEGDLSRLLLDPATAGASAGVSFFTVDGVRFAHMHMDARTMPFEQPAETLVLGVLPNNDDVFVGCTEQAMPDLVRAGCQQVIDSLHIRA
jgi:hypothetical protein